MSPTTGAGCPTVPGVVHDIEMRQSAALRALPAPDVVDVEAVPVVDPESLL